MSRKYNEKTIGSIGVDDEGSWGHKTGVTVKVDTLEKATIRFGSSYTLRINEEDVEALCQLLHNASIELTRQRNINNELEHTGVDDETEDMETQPPVGTSKFFSSLIPEC